MRTSSALRAAVGLLIIVPLLAQAASFPDTTGHMYQQSIDSMEQAGVLKGYPDGKFYPEKEVNRAEMATIIARAMGYAPVTAAADCFPDVKKDQWFAGIVCDWAQKEKGILTGYSDGKFKPENKVSRVEALAMIFRAMHLPVADVTDSDRMLLPQGDVSFSAWYTRYLVAAYKLKILPIAGQSGASFFPAKPLLRGEAAAYVTAALAFQAASSSSSSVSSAEISVSSSTASSVSSSVSSVTDDITSITIPSTLSGQFDKRKTKSLSFFLPDTKTTVSFQASVTGYYIASLSCRLYLIGKDGFSNEYYIGVQDGQTCTIKATVPRGNYQIQMQPSVADVSYAIDLKKGTGDGMDGFTDAVPLTKNSAKTNLLDSGDIYDVYSFTVDKAGKGLVQVTSTANPKLTTVIYLPPGFDQYGFKGPEEGVWYDYQPGTYYIVIAHTGQLAQKQTYTVSFKWQQ